MLQVRRPSKTSKLLSFSYLPEPRWLSILVLTIVVFFAIVATLHIYQEVTEPKSGEVYNKRYHPPYTSYTSTVVSNGSGGSSTITTPIHHPERWTIYYRQWDSDAGKWRKGDADVHKEYFDSVELGDFVNFGGIDEEQ